MEIVDKHLVRIEFRYEDVPKGEYDPEHKSKTITIGVFDTFEDACIEGNKALEVLEKHFKIHVFPGNKEAKKDRFSKNGGCFGGKQNLITNLAYLQTPFSFYARIETLKYEDVETTILSIVEAKNRYKEHKNKEHGD